MKKLYISLAIAAVLLGSRASAQFVIDTGAEISANVNAVGIISGANYGSTAAHGFAGVIAMVGGVTSIVGLDSNGKPVGPGSSLVWNNGFSWNGLSLNGGVSFDYSFDANDRLLLTYSITILGQTRTGARIFNITKQQIRDGTHPISSPPIPGSSGFSGSTGTWTTVAVPETKGEMNWDTGVYTLTGYTAYYIVWLPIQRIAPPVYMR